MVNYEGFDDVFSAQPDIYAGDFAGTGTSQLLFINPHDRNCWLGSFDPVVNELSWRLAGIKRHLGFPGEPRSWIGRFLYPKSDQVLLYYPQSKSWVYGRLRDTDDFAWELGDPPIAHSILNGEPTAHKQWIGHFASNEHDQVLSFSPETQKWQLHFGNNSGKLDRASITPAGEYKIPQRHSRFWVGNFSRGDIAELFIYHPDDQSWRLGLLNTTYFQNRPSFQMNWTKVATTAAFGDLLQGHKVWVDRFSSPDRDQVLVYAPQDHKWWLGTYDSTARKINWPSAPVSEKNFDNLASDYKLWIGNFSRSDQKDILIYKAQDRVFSRGSFEGTRELNWTFAGSTDRPHQSRKSADLRRKLQSVFEQRAPGCVFYVTRNGQPYADGSFGYGRLPNAPDGELAMSPNTLVHIGSIGKVICAVAILRLIEEKNWSFENQRAYEILQQNNFFDRDMVNRYQNKGEKFPGENIERITLFQLLHHYSGLALTTKAAGFPRGYRVRDLPEDMTYEDVEPTEPVDGRRAYTDLRRVVTALCKQEAKPSEGVPNKFHYSNQGFCVLGAIIEAATGQKYPEWVRSRLFAGFDDINRSIGDRLREARYYVTSGTSFTGGVRHSDYTDFGAAGGWYVSAGEFCRWIEAVIKKKKIGDRPILNHPERLSDVLSSVHVMEKLALDADHRHGRLQGFGHSGGAWVGGGETNAKFVYLRGYGDECYCIFAQTNTDMNAHELLVTGIEALSDSLSRPGPSPSPPANATRGLIQAVYWDEAGARKSDSRISPVTLENVRVVDVTRERTNLFGGSNLAGSKRTWDLVMVELRGFIGAAGAGLYRFRISSDDGAFMWFDDEPIINNAGNHGLRSVESAPVYMEANGWYPIRFRWYNAGGPGGLFLEWRTPDTTEYKSVPSANFAAAE